jgi:hypothetical protein
MKLKLMFTLSAILFLIWGVVLFFGDVILGLVGGGLVATNIEVYLARAISSVILGMAVLAWMARDAGPGPARKAIVASFIVSNALAVLVNLIGLIGGTVPQAAWSGVVLNGLLAIGFVAADRQSE